MYLLLSNGPYASSLYGPTLRGYVFSSPHNLQNIVLLSCSHMLSAIDHHHLNALSTNG